ncbi:oligomeric, coiled-coil, peripheral membrane protein [Xylographa soralifera]|nr:oligomeric, coiled-coil, peripheral membrane protein [Xylographa soralifera]
MTARGKPVKLQTLLTENEIFVYDRELLSPASSGAPKTKALRISNPAAFVPQEPPGNLSNEESTLGEWQKLFRDRRAWAIRLSAECEGYLREAEGYDKEATVIQRATAIAVENVKQHVGGLHENYEAASIWARDAVREHSIVLNSWESSLQQLSSIPAKSELLLFIRKQGRSTSDTTDYGSNQTLQAFIDVARVRQAALHSRKISQRLERQSSELASVYEDVVQKSTDLIGKFNTSFVRANTEVSDTATSLVEEIEAIVKKISSDYENNLGLAETPKSVATIAKSALLHTRNFLPSLVETATESGQLLRKTIDRKNTIMQSALIYMQKISTIESALAELKPRLAALNIGVEDGHALDAIGLPRLLPSLYGSLLIEVVQRREWDEKMTADSSTLAEEMGIHKEEEERRRKRWLKMMSNHLRPEALDGKAMGIEVNLQIQEIGWPRITRDDIAEYLSVLESIGDQEETIKEVQNALKSLDAPTRQQTRRNAAFKNGSVHEAAFARNSLLLRGDDDLLRSLQSDKSKLEDRLRGSESRIRKLEDLLHRQSHIPKPSGGNALGPSNGPALERYATTPVLNQASSSPKAQDNLSRHSSISSRRFSANYGTEEKALALRLVKLEGDLISEKTKSTELEAVSEDHVKALEELRSQVQEALSTKKDLLDNFEAQQHEFDGERRLFVDENNKLKLRLEELEEELDRILGSHDNARIGLDEKTRNLDMEIEKIRREAAEEVQKAHGQIDFLKSDYTLQRERAYKLERQMQQQQHEKEAMEARLASLLGEVETRDAMFEEITTTLQAMHLQLSTDENVPNDLGSLVEAIEILVERSTSHQQELRQALETLRADNALVEARSKRHEQEVATLNDQIGSEKEKCSRFHEEKAQYEAHKYSLQRELNDERHELGRLRSKFAAGETGSEALRSRVAEEEKKVEEISTKLGAANVHLQQYEIELTSKTSALESLETARSNIESHLKSRARRAEELSAMLFNHTDRLSRLLEHIGFTITKQEDGMVVQKTPRTVSASTTLVDQSQSMNRSMSAPLPAKSEETPPEYLHWAMADDLNNETQSYDTFLRDMQTFNMDTFSEAVIKRVKESEHTARKWQREARAYREKSRRAQLEAHEKIAYRSFKDGDLALFLPTRNQATRPWAAFNVGAPHYFLREQDSHKLRTRDWLLARISKVEERVVDLSKSITGSRPASDRRRNSIASTSDGGASFDDENPFELSDGLRWYLLDAQEEKPGAPTTPGLGKSTVASANVDARGSIQRKKTSDESRATKTLTKSLDSRRSSSGSKMSIVAATTTARPSSSTSAAIPEGVAQISAQNEAAVDSNNSRSPSRPGSASANKLSDTEEDRRSRTASPSKLSTVTNAPQAQRQSPQKSPDKPKTRAWEGLWSLDLSLGDGGKGRS